jgi:hypothetical protein
VRLTAWLAAACAAGLAAGAIVLTSDHEDAKAGTLALLLPVGWAFIAAGMIAWSREPANRVGRLMVATGFAWFLGALSLANQPLCSRSASSSTRCPTPSSSTCCSLIRAGG